MCGPNFPKPHLFFGVGEKRPTRWSKNRLSRDKRVGRGGTGREGGGRRRRGKACSQCGKATLREPQAERRSGMSKNPFRARRGPKTSHIGPSLPHLRPRANGNPRGLPLRDAKRRPPMQQKGDYDPNGPSVPQPLRVLPCPAEQYGPPCEGGLHWGMHSWLPTLLGNSA